MISDVDNDGVGFGKLFVIVLGFEMHPTVLIYRRSLFAIETILYNFGNREDF